MSRPKREVLVYCQSMIRLSAVTLVLRTRRYRVITATTEAEATLLASARKFDAALVLEYLEADRAVGLVNALRLLAPDTPVMLAIERPIETPSLATLVCPARDMAGMLEALRVLCVRKRGPKKAAKPVKEAMAA